jgi:LacI family transcriptional regulator
MGMARTEEPKPSAAAKPTIAMVAARADVAVSTVSRYLNGGYVSEAVRARLSEVIREIGYVPSTTARYLSLGRRGPIGVVVGGIEGPWFNQLLAGIEEELTRSHGSLMLASLALSGRYKPGVAEGWVSERRVDGLIIAPSTPREQALIDRGLEARLPLVTVAPDRLDLPVGSVRCDNLGGGRQAASHLVGLGHTHIAFAGGPSFSLDSQHRLIGLREGLADEGVTLPDDLVFFCETYEPESGMAFGKYFLRHRSNVTALVMGNDALALGFMRSVLQAGWRVPEELSVVGFDGIPEASRFWPGLTTLSSPTREMGRIACRKLLRAIEDPDSEEATAPVEYPMTLIERESTGPARTQPSRRAAALA